MNLKNNKAQRYYTDESQRHTHVFQMNTYFYVYEVLGQVKQIYAGKKSEKRLLRGGWEGTGKEHTGIFWELMVMFFIGI